MSRVLAAILGATLSLTVLSGCSDDKDDANGDAGKETPGAPSSPDDATESVDPDRVSPTDLPKVPKIKGQGAIRDASFGDCHVEAGKQTVEGTITSTAKVARDYVVTVSWINETSDVLARGIAVVEALEPSASQDFQLSTEVPEGASVCTFNVMRGTIKS